MGSILQQSLRSDPDASRPVGAIPQASNASVMRIRRDKSSELFYEGESAINVGWRDVEIVTSERHFKWWRLEGRVRQDQQVGHGHGFVVVEHPYSLGTFSTAPFRRGSHHSEELRDKAGQMHFGSPSQVMEWVENLKYDFWHSGNDCIAGISRSSPSFSPSGKSRNPPKGALYVFATCEDHAVDRDSLLSSPHVRKLAQLVEQRRIHFWPKSFISELQLPDELVSEGESLLYLAVQQSLGGPHRESEKWIGLPVWKKVSLIFRSHLYNRWRSIMRRDKLELNAPPARDDDFDEHDWDDC
jgi:hypothetical protein